MIYDKFSCTSFTIWLIFPYNFYIMTNFLFLIERDIPNGQFETALFQSDHTCHTGPHCMFYILISTNWTSKRKDTRLEMHDMLHYCMLTANQMFGSLPQICIRTSAAMLKQISWSQLLDLPLLMGYIHSLCWLSAKFFLQPV